MSETGWGQGPLNVSGLDPGFMTSQNGSAPGHFLSFILYFLENSLYKNYFYMHHVIKPIYLFDPKLSGIPEKKKKKVCKPINPCLKHNFISNRKYDRHRPN